MLDATTQSLDFESEAPVQKALNRLMQNPTTLIITHRLSIVQHATRILVLNERRIVQSGSYDAIIAEDRVYKQLRDLPFREPEGDSVAILLE